MSQQRYSFKTLQLHDGRVLAIGDQYIDYGDTCGECFPVTGPENGSKHADLWDPTTGKWTPTSGLASNRSGYAALVLQDGRVLVTAGSADSTKNYPENCFSSTWLFDPATEKWNKAAGLMHVARCDAAFAPLPDGRVMVIGGSGIHGNSLASTEIFNPSSRTWSAGPAMPSARSIGMQAVTLTTDKILVVGSGSSAVEYDPSTKA
jgi:N-acetylneuraminic acid mutarotase